MQNFIRLTKNYKMSSIYEPAEDSYLMSETLKEKLSGLLKKNKNLKFLEIGCGSGINLKAALSTGVKINNILGADINKEAVKHCSALGFNCVQSNLFSNIKGKFDIIIFNPPYLPLDRREPKASRLNTTAGKGGNELIIKFLKEAKAHLSKEGKVLLITSSLSQDIDFEKLGYRAKEIANKKLFFEKLFLWKLISQTNV